MAVSNEANPRFPREPTMLTSSRIVFVSFAAAAVVAGNAGAQYPEVRVELPRGSSSVISSANRAVLGVSLSVGAKGDTLGLEVQDVTADGPAARAGIMVGSRIQAINGVSLRISADDAADPLTSDAGLRRLQRELGKLTVGDQTSLRVLSNGQPRNVSVTTVSAQALDGGLFVRLRTPVAISREAMANRAALGISVGSAGNARDTLGMFVSAVVNDGPAETAGIIEGERIAAINGVDVRVPREDVLDGIASSARVSRFLREVERATPGDTVTLRVFANGRYRDVRVTAARASEVAGAGFPFGSDEPSSSARRAAEGVRARVLQFEQLAPRAPVPGRASAGVRTVRAIL